MNKEQKRNIFLCVSFQVTHLQGFKMPSRSKSLQSEEIKPFTGVIEGNDHVEDSVSKLLVVKGIIFAISGHGYCTAFDTVTKSRHCLLNNSQDEKIRNMLYNINDESLLVVAEYTSNARCWSLPIIHIRRNSPEERFEVFSSIQIECSSCVVFEAASNKAIIFSKQERVFKVFDLKSYAFVYQTPATWCSKLTICSGALVKLSQFNTNLTAFNIVSGDNGDELAQFTYELPVEDITFVFPLSEKVLLIDHLCYLHVLDLKRREGEYRPEVYLPITDRILLPKKDMFLGLREREVQAWDSEGSILTGFDDHLVVDYSCFYYETFVTEDMFIISHCCPKHCRNMCRSGHIHISDIKTGKCITRLCLRAITHEVDDVISSLFYDEENSEIYIGTERGRLHVLSR